MTSIILGIIIPIKRLTNKLVLVNLIFALSNRSSSCFSVPNVLITGIPVIISLDTRFILSISFCILLNFGIAKPNKMPIKTKITINAIPIIQFKGLSLTLMNAPIPMMGAKTTIRSNIIKNIFICSMSFVDLVIKLDAPNSLNSLEEKLIIFLTTFSLKTYPILAANLATKNPTIIAITIPAPAIPSIINPLFII